MANKPTDADDYSNPTFSVATMRMLTVIAALLSWGYQGGGIRGAFLVGLMLAAFWLVKSVYQLVASSDLRREEQE